jgi:hypothetical protein
LRHQAEINAIDVGQDVLHKNQHAVLWVFKPALPTFAPQC